MGDTEQRKIPEALIRLIAKNGDDIKDITEIRESDSYWHIVDWFKKYVIESEFSLTIEKH